jgi:hypothetical protein
MANQNYAFGFKWIGDIGQGILSGAVHAYSIPSTDSNNYFVGDAVKSTGTALVINGVTYPSVIGASASDTVRGVIVSVAFNPLNLNILYAPASTQRIVYVADAPYAKFLIQTNGVGALTDIGSNANSVLGSGSTTTGISGTQLDETTITTSANQLRILDVYPTPDNSIGQYAKYEVMFNLHEFKTTTGV